MRRNFDIFEKFPDGSAIWRSCTNGKFEAQRTIQSLSEHSKNDFLAIDLMAAPSTAVQFSMHGPQRASRALAKRTA